MEKQIEVKITLGDKALTISGPEDFVRAEVQRLTNMLSTATASASGAAPPARPTPTGGLPSTERQFVAEKRPKGHLEMVAVLAFYLTQSGQAEFGPEDVRRSYIRAGERPPKVTSQALRDAKNIKDFIITGKTKGTFRLSPHGERFVLFDLPGEK